MVKKALKFLLAFVLSIGVGLIIAGCVVSLITEMTFYQFFQKLLAIKIGDILLSAVIGMGGCVLSYLILIPIHELGHLVAGLLSGYRFISFRVFNFILIKKDGKFKIKKFKIAGTVGQCLLDAPQVATEKVPVFWYNAGGVLTTILVFLSILPLMWVTKNPWISELIFVFLLTDFLIILMNAIPMRIGGMGNDGYNLLLLRKSKLSRQGMVAQLRCNALIQEGLRPKDLPTELFFENGPIDYRNSLEVAIPLMRGSIMLDKGDREEARRLYEELYSHKEELLPIYSKEIRCELIWLRLLDGNRDGANELLDAETRKYIETYRNVMSSKERILCGIAMLLEEDGDEAEAIYQSLLTRRDQYLLKGEVESDIEQMKKMLEAFGV